MGIDFAIAVKAFVACSCCAYVYTNRLQREEIRQKQEKLDNMLKKKKPESSSAARPESPGGTRRRFKRPLLQSRRLMNGLPRTADISTHSVSGNLKRS